ncbi:MAG: diguanylate cyclase [Burkholderiaceae bacterium]
MRVALALLSIQRFVRRLLPLLSLLLCASVLVGSGAFADQGMPAGNVDVLHDAGGELDWVGARTARGWTRLDRSRVAARLPEGALWLRWQLPGRPGENARLRLAPPDAGDIEVRVLDARERVIDRYRIGATMPLAERTLQRAQAMIPWPTRGTGPWTVLARQQGRSLSVFNPAIVRPAAPERVPRALPDPAWLTVTLLASLLLLSGMTALATRDGTQLALAVLLLSQAFVSLQVSGLAFELFWPDTPEWNPHARNLSMALLAAAGAWLAYAMVARSARASRLAAFVLRASAGVSLAGALTVSMVPAWASASIALTAAGLTLSTVAVQTFARVRAHDLSMVWLLPGLTAVTLSAAPSEFALLGLAGPAAWPDPIVVMVVTSIGALLCTLTVIMRHRSRDWLDSIARAGQIDQQSQAMRMLEQTVGARTFELEVANEQLARQTRVDGLTGVFNRRHFDEQFADAIRQGHQRGSAVAVMMVDLDHFKRLNDEHGHAFGDECLRRAARLAAASLSNPQAIAARYGGEEFVVLMRDCLPGDALASAERIRAAIEAEMPELDGTRVRMTASLGVCCRVPAGSDAGPSMLAAADAALYQAKHGGRNRVCDAASPSAAATAATPSPPDPSGERPPQPIDV